MNYARLGKYLALASQHEALALELYCSNARLSKSFYIAIQIWEIVLRNRINNVLVWKYGKNWPFDDVRALRNLGANERRRIDVSKERQNRVRGKGNVTTNQIVADLSAGFWVSLLTKSYDIPLSWRYNLIRVFPNHVCLDRQQAADMCEGILDLRNRIAHHEPILHLRLLERRQNVESLVYAMCPAHAAYLKEACTFAQEWEIHSAIAI